MKNKKEAVVVFSGGQDSTTCLAWALKIYEKVYAVSFDYGQRHSKELACAAEIAKELGVEHHIINLKELNELAPNSLTREDIEVDKEAPEEGPPNSFVEGRNMLFLTYAAIFAKTHGVTDIIIDGKSIVDEYVATIPVATDSERGVVKFDNDTIVINSEGQIKVVNLVEDITLKHLLLDNVSSEGVRTKHTSEGTIVDPADRVCRPPPQRRQGGAQPRAGRTCVRCVILVHGFAQHLRRASVGGDIRARGNYHRRREARATSG